MEIIISASKKSFSKSELPPLITLSIMYHLNEKIAYEPSILKLDEVENKVTNIDLAVLLICCKKLYQGILREYINSLFISTHNYIL